VRKKDMKQDEKAIINRVLNGDERAYAILIDRYKEGLYRHCFYFVRDEDGAEDIAQEAFIKAYVSLVEYDQVHAFSTWLYKIATNIALSELRRKRPLPLDESAIDLLVSELPRTELAAIHVELYEAIEKLPGNHKQVVKLHYFQGMSYERIAKTMNTTTGSVKGWMNRARTQLKEMLS
jgi:RNA polymerase sigma factor (sigma-70 family)